MRTSWRVRVETNRFEQVLPGCADAGGALLRAGARAAHARTRPRKPDPHRQGDARGGGLITNGRRRVVITGLGAVTPLGNDVLSSWEKLVTAAGGVGPITAFDASAYPVRFACELKEFDPGRWLERKQVRRLDRFAQMIVAAARQAEADAGLEIATEPDHVGVSAGTGMGGLNAAEWTYVCRW